MALWCWGGGMYDGIKLVQFLMKVNAYNLKYSQANSEENGSAKSTHWIVIFITQNN